MMLSRVVDGYFRRAQALFAYSAVAVTLTASSAFGQAPPVVVDAQQTIGSSYNNPQSVAVAPNGTVYVADTKQPAGCTAQHQFAGSVHPDYGEHKPIRP